MDNSPNKRHPEEPDPIIVDFKKKDTEYGWMLLGDRVALKFVPAWFTYLGWILTLAAFQFLFKSSKSWILAIIVTISSVGIWRYLTAVFWQYEFRGIPFVKSEKTYYWISCIIAGLLSFLGWQLANYIAKLLVDYQQKV